MKDSPGGRDWNGNGKSDSFDHFIDYKASSNSNNTASNSKTDTQPAEQTDTPQNNGAVILKSLLTIGLCIAALVLPASADMGPLGTVIFSFSAVAICVLIWRG